MIGIASDGANVMQGIHHSVVALFKKDIPHLFSLLCSSHSLALCASKAAEKLPSGLEKFLKSVYMYLKYSNKRTQKFREIQTMLDVPQHRILNTCDVRWLSLR